MTTSIIVCMCGHAPALGPLVRARFRLTRVGVAGAVDAGADAIAESALRPGPCSSTAFFCILLCSNAINSGSSQSYNTKGWSTVKITV